MDRNYMTCSEQTTILAVCVIPAPILRTVLVSAINPVRQGLLERQMALINQIWCRSVPLVSQNASCVLQQQNQNASHSMPAALPVWSCFQKIRPCDHYLSFFKLHKHHLTKQSPLWMVIPGGTATQGDANKRRADSEAGVFNIQNA